jgi:hypothetical protein
MKPLSPILVPLLVFPLQETPLVKALVPRRREKHNFPSATNKRASAKSKLAPDLVKSSEGNNAFQATIQQNRH